MLDPAVFNTDVWRKIAAHLETEVGRLRAANDERLTSEETAEVRGQIRYLKGLLHLGTPRKLIQPTEADFYTQ